MELSIAVNIRRLRKERNMTQEELAGFWNLSFQTISKWERGEGYPDITMLPIIAGFFGISVDELIGMEKIRKEEKLEEIHKLWKKENSLGKNKENVLLMREALKSYPENYQLMVQLVTSLEKWEGPSEKMKENREEAINISERILKYCPDYEIRNTVLFNICYSYWKNGNVEKAMERANLLPNQYKTRENALIMFQSGNVRIETGQNAVVALIDSIFHQVSCMCNEEYYTVEERLKLLRKTIKIADIAFEQDDVVEILRCKTKIYEKMADIYLIQNDRKQALVCLQKAVDYILKSEVAENSSGSVSLLANIIVADRITSVNYQKLQFSKKLMDKKYEVLGQYPEFQSLYNKLL